MNFQHKYTHRQAVQEWQHMFRGEGICKVVGEGQFGLYVRRDTDLHIGQELHLFATAEAMEIGIAYMMGQNPRFVRKSPDHLEEPYREKNSAV